MARNASVAHMEQASVDRLDGLQALLEDFYHERDWRRFQTLKDLAASTAVEAAELQQLFLWRDDESLVLEERSPEVAGELADILINLMNFARLAGVDLVDACIEKLRELERRYPASAVRGRVVPKEAKQ
jgi:NTP pyrophosphatase (non-canonical NTP hydrolase)